MSNESISSERIRERAQSFRRLCHELGIDATNKNPVCQRLEAAEQFCTATAPLDYEDYSVLIRTGEFLWLADCLEYLKDRIKGTIHIDNLVAEKTHSNEVAELMTAFLVEQAGFPALFAEPDVVAKVGTDDVVLACKKLDSERKLLARVSEARDQIVASKKQGIIVVDVSRIVEYPTGAMYAAEKDAYNSLDRATDILWGRYERQLLEKMRQPAINSLLLISSQFCSIRRSIDHDKRVVQGVSFHGVHFSLRTRMHGRAPHVITLEDAIMKWGSRVQPVS